MLGRAGARVVFALAFALLLTGTPRPAAAQEWFDDYARGVEALRRGRAAAAVTLLEQAVRKRPEPGENVLTYGTNRLARYHPYLHLADALIRLDRHDEAREALKRSEHFGREPAATRDALRARIEPQYQAAAPPPPAVAKEPEPTPAPTPLPATPPPPTPTPEPAATAAPALPSARPTARAAATPAPGGSPSSAPSAPPAVVLGALVVFSDPPGASVYVDDEPVGATDPASGRLVKSGLPPGKHRVRLALAGRADWSADVDLAAGAPTTVRGTLSMAPVETGSSSMTYVVVAGLLGLTALLALVWRRRGGGPDAFEDSTVAMPLEPRAGRTPVPHRTPRPRPAPDLGQGDSSDTLDRLALEGSGESFGEFTLTQQLGRGGMACVYRAERRGEAYALKLPLAGLLEDPHFRERFLREAEIGRTLHHPNIVRILEQGEVDGIPWFTMELVEGRTLQDVLRKRGKLPVREATRLVAEVAEALDYAHLKGVVHRDLKPSNIMVAADGSARVMDYGIARARRFDGLTVTGSFMGTPDYVTPEAAEGRPVDLRSDLYSLGVVFYEMVTGVRPFAADTPFATIRRHCSEPPQPPSVHLPGLPRELEAIILRLLEKAPDDRYPGAEELVVDLRGFLNRAA
jgi:LPXTG-motif cell wall-anchored protein